MEYHTEDCESRTCHGSCHEGELECLACGVIWFGEWEEAPDVCECGEPWPDSSDTDTREDFHSDG
jgi:hypothetical protein